MKCPKCKNEMEYVRQEETNNPDTNKRYTRQVHTCKDDDIWVTIEVPVENPQTTAAAK